MSPSNNEIMSDSSGELDPPPESYQLHLGADLDWINMHKVYERDDSVKETTNPKYHGHLHNSKNVGSNSQRFSGNLKSGIIGLPANIQNSSILGHSARRPSFVRMIPNGGGGKLSGLETEPGSPKVSCMGKVMSEKPKCRSQLHHKSRTNKTPRSAAKKNSKPEANKTPAKTEHKGPGCLFRMARIFCSSKKRAMDMVDESIRLEKGNDCSLSARIGLRNDVKTKGRRSLERDSDGKETVIAEKERDSPVPVPVPGLGGIKRFASGRKEDWNFEMGNDNSSESKEGKSPEKDVEVKEITTNFEDEKDTSVPVLVLGIEGLKRFASGRKVDWSFDTETDGGNLDKDEIKENSKLENDDNINQNNSLEKENDPFVTVPVFGISVMKKFASDKRDTKESNAMDQHVDNKEAVAEPVLGIGLMKKFPSGRKVEWTFGVDSDKGCIAEEKEKDKDKKTLKLDDDVKQRDTLGAVSVPVIGAMKRFASGRKADWNFEETSEKDDSVKVTDSSEKENHIPAVLSVPRIGSMKRFASGRKVDWNFEVEIGNVDEAEKENTMDENVDVKDNNINVFKNGKNTPVMSAPHGIGGMKKFKSGRKLDWNFEVKA